MGRRRAMFQRWKKDVLVTWFMCFLKESVETSSCVDVSWRVTS